MNSTDDNQQQKIERYVLGQMNDDEATDFEISYLSDPVCVEQLEIAENFYQGIRKLAESSPLMESQPPVFKWWQSSIPAWSMAATFLIMCIPSLLIWQWSAKPLSQPSALQVVSFPLAVTRGVQEIDVIVERDFKKSLVLSTYVDTDVIGYATFSLGINSNSKQLLTLENISPTEEGLLFFNLGIENLADGQFKLLLYGNSPDGFQQLIKQGKLTIK